VNRVRVSRVIHLVGLKRSGTHALANWLLGMDAGAVLLNNSPMKRFGLAPPMARTLRNSPIPVHLHRGSEAIALDGNGRERRVRLEDGQSLVIVLWQSQSLDHLNTHPWLCGIEAASTQVLLLLRDPFNWLASVYAKASASLDADGALAAWGEYAREYSRDSGKLPQAIPISYNRWLSDRDYRGGIASQLALCGDDRYFRVVTPHAGGSSFDGMRFNGNAARMRLTDRWQHYADDRTYRRALARNHDALHRGLELFDLPRELQQFVRTLQPG
jgi:hypothetical protein